jgi:glycosyltransferase involved in cell wall biosynthesis
MHMAIAHGTPVLATQVGGLREGIRDGIDGRLVPASDPAALATAIAEMIAEPDRLAEMGQRAQDRYRRERSWAQAGRELVDACRYWLDR